MAISALGISAPGIALVGISTVGISEFSDPLTPFFTEEPESQSTTVGQSPVFSSNASVGQGVVTYQWQLNTGGGFGNIIGATLKTLALLPVVIGQNGNQFRVVATANARPVFSVAVTLTVTL